jgi:hypothetical protein
MTNVEREERWPQARGDFEIHHSLFDIRYFLKMFPD